ncbi:peptidase inhibitor family I36 protein [Amycolatopsis orientalis]|uniref:peptidase inhibitor family I36 protein n=1 Tax=Amycolatopsis orientalis TaxID=31958 RepID=UPI00039EE3B0|nr:peptidase inhibitor family I36 protein [Amycolatopsis orientalis]
MFRRLLPSLPFPGRRSRPAALPAVLLLVTAGLLTSSGLAQAAPAADPGPACDAGEFCLWDTETYSGNVQSYDLRTANPGDCIPLPEGFQGHSFVNRMTRDVTIYQGADCSTEGDFITYPGGGTYVPQSPFAVRALKVWE